MDGGGREGRRYGKTGRRWRFERERELEKEPRAPIIGQSGLEIGCRLGAFTGWRRRCGPGLRGRLAVKPAVKPAVKLVVKPAVKLVVKPAVKLVVKLGVKQAVILVVNQVVKLVVKQRRGPG